MPTFAASLVPLATLAAATAPAAPLLELRPVDLAVTGDDGDRAPTPEDGARPATFGYGRAAMEIGVAMGLGAAWYEAQVELNKLDWDFARSWSGQWQRLGTARGYRFDDNEPVLNVGHAFVGMFEHDFARANHATMLQAFLFDLTASTVWELTVEHREVFSLNDTVVTSVGGVALGEPLFQLGELFARSAPGWRNAALMALFSPGRAVASLSETGRLPRARSFDDHGLADDVYHRFAIGAGAALGAGAGAAQRTDGSGAGFASRVDMEVLNLTAYGRAGRAQQRLRGGEATRVTFDYEGTQSDLAALSLVTRTSLFGRYTQDITGEARGRRGRSLLLAAGSAFDLSIADRPRATDLLTAVHVFGPTADASFYRGRFALRVAADLYGDFAMVRPFALDPDGSDAVLEGTKSVLANHHYYYALGVSAATRVEASYRALRAGAALEWNGFDSIEGLDRRQEAMTSPAGVYHAAISDDFDVTDQRLKMRLYTDVPTPVDELRLGLAVDLQRRSGQMKDLARAADEGRASVLLTYVM